MCTPTLDFSRAAGARGRRPRSSSSSITTACVPTRTSLTCFKIRPHTLIEGLEFPVRIRFGLFEECCGKPSLDLALSRFRGSLVRPRTIRHQSHTPTLLLLHFNSGMFQISKRRAVTSPKPKPTAGRRSPPNVSSNASYRPPPACEDHTTFLSRSFAGKLGTIVTYLPFDAGFPRDGAQLAGAVEALEDHARVVPASRTFLQKQNGDLCLNNTRAKASQAKGERPKRGRPWCFFQSNLSPKD